MVWKCAVYVVGVCLGKLNEIWSARWGKVIKLKYGESDAEI